MSDATAMRKLRELAARLIERQDHDAAWFSACLSEYASGARHGITLGDAFGFGLTRGATPWWEFEACMRRDDALRSLAARHFADLRATPAATALMQALARYKASAWRQHRGKLSPPEGLPPLQLALFELLKISAPLSLGTVRRALAHDKPVFVSGDSGDAVAG